MACPSQPPEHCIQKLLAVVGLTALTKCAKQGQRRAGLIHVAVQQGLQDGRASSWLSFCRIAGPTCARFCAEDWAEEVDGPTNSLKVRFGRLKPFGGGPICLTGCIWPEVSVLARW
uniref:Uncharacterized protein n=1 Tax=Ditylenchus dipsaci TaxID=166011 RepID=A0A915EMC3_9BILA